MVFLLKVWPLCGGGESVREMVSQFWRWWVSFGDGESVLEVLSPF